MKKTSPITTAFQPLTSGAVRPADGSVHFYGNGVRCATNSRGYPTPDGMNPLKLILEATHGFIPLWDKGCVLNWRFDEASMNYFERPAAAMDEIENLLGEALVAWGDASPLKFSKQTDAWDFQIVVAGADDCIQGGCTLAMAFFPDAGRHHLWLYPKFFTQARAEQVDTLIHETGHMFGLRHFFAEITEARWASVRFGKHEPFTIMNYGHQSSLTKADRSDLKLLYEKVWSRELTEISDTRIRLVRPHHEASTP